MFLEQVAPRWGRITKAGSDAEQFATQQTEYLGKVADTLVVFPYGIHGNVPPDALALLLAMQGNPDNRAAIAWTPKIRPTLVEGEVAFYHPPTGSLAVWRPDGTLEITTGANIVATCANLTANVSGDTTVDSGGNVAVTAGGAATVDASSATVTASTITLNGTVVVNGNFSVSGTMTNSGTNVGATHYHTQGVDSNGDTQENTSGAN